MDKNTRYVCMIPFANHVTWQQTHHWLNLFVFSFFFFRRKANGDTNWYRLNAKISIANYSNHKNSRSFFWYIVPQLSDRKWSPSIWKIDIVCKTYHARANFVLFDLFFSGYVRVIRFALNGMDGEWFGYLYESLISNRCDSSNFASSYHSSSTC